MVYSAASIAALEPGRVNVVDAPTPPAQRATGPGGSDYAYERVRVTAYGEGAEGYWIIEPTQSAKTDEPLPVVLFAHGLNQINYRAYDAWLRHLARRGNLVIYPRYQTGGVIDPKSFTPAAARAMREALERCDATQHAKADRERIAMIGHSVGGTIVANLAARPEHFGLPAPQALMLLQPGDTRADRGLGALLPSLTEEHATIAAGTLMLVVDVEDDYFVSPLAGQRILDRAVRIEAQDKNRLLLRDDAHGLPALQADHVLPFAWRNGPGPSPAHADAYDFAMWRWFDALQATAYGDASQRPIALGNTPEQLDLGAWSDGEPVREPDVIEFTEPRR